MTADTGAHSGAWVVLFGGRDQGGIRALHRCCDVAAALYSFRALS